ncbi:MAG: hypothetical protein FD177_920 [Desulfovibrionaceae bacterium]|nr:MAG: hypothetical protein FD177_920 [Desulfovibrionaceae bacterium]
MGEPITIRAPKKSALEDDPADEAERKLALSTTYDRTCREEAERAATEWVETGRDRMMKDICDLLQSRTGERCDPDDAVRVLMRGIEDKTLHPTTLPMVKDIVKANLRETKLFVQQTEADFAEVLKKKSIQDKRYIGKDKQLVEKLTKHKVKVFDLIDYFNKHTYSAIECEGMCEKMVGKKVDSPYYVSNKGEKRIWAFINVEGKEAIAKKHGMSIDMLNKHINELTRCGILKKFPKDGSHGRQRIAVGYWNWITINKGLRVPKLITLQREDKDQLAALRDYRVKPRQAWVRDE